MENDRDREWAPFMQGQAEYARSVLDAIPGRKKLLERIAALSGDSSVTRSVQTGGDRIFYENRPVGASVYRICVRDGLKGEERGLVDPATVRIDGKHVSIDWWSASPNGRFVAYGQSPAGSEMATTHVIEVETGRLLPERIERTPFIPAAWLAFEKPPVQLSLRCRYGSRRARSATGVYSAWSGVGSWCRTLSNRGSGDGCQGEKG